MAQGIIPSVTISHAVHSVRHSFRVGTPNELYSLKQLHSCSCHNSPSEGSASESPSGGKTTAGRSRTNSAYRSSCDGIYATVRNAAQANTRRADAMVIYLICLFNRVGPSIQSQRTVGSFASSLTAQRSFIPMSSPLFVDIKLGKSLSARKTRVPKN
jgi:hypothetical protein